MKLDAHEIHKILVLRLQVALSSIGAKGRIYSGLELALIRYLCFDVVLLNAV